MSLYLKLRSNITLEGDLQLALREVNFLFRNVTPIRNNELSLIPNYVPNTQKTSYTRKGDIIGYIVDSPTFLPEKLPILLSFIQEIWTPLNYFTDCLYSVACENAACTIPLMAMSEYLSYATTIDDNTIKDIAYTLAGVISEPRRISKCLNRANTSSPHIHGFHKYKAKFFPRFVRSLIVSNLDLEQESLVICDPYVGSGTTLIESSLMGINSFGYDIDSLSCFISEAKANAVNITINELGDSLSGFKPLSNVISYTFPEEIQKKFERWNTLNEMHEYEHEISNELNLIESETGSYKIINQIALSDALTRKFTIRMMGTGSGRFALEIGKTSLQTLLKGNIKNSIHALAVVKKLKELYKLKTPTGKVIKGDATNRDCADNYCDLIITSPPYLPASSGREDYLVGKMISLKALGLYHDKEEIMHNSVGSMLSKKDKDLDNLPNSVIQLYNWLINDELRKIKAAPIVAYYNSLRESLLEDKRTIKETGKIIYIIGKESVFYSNTTKEILYKVECDQIFQEIAKSIGLKIIDVINIELDKKSSVARPRSSDKYYETAIIMSK